MEKTKKQKKINFKQILKKNWVCYLFILPMLIYVIIFNYIPMYGIQLAFKDYRVADGIWGSAWVVAAALIEGVALLAVVVCLLVFFL